MTEELRNLIEKVDELLALIANTPEASPDLLSAAEWVRIKLETLRRKEGSPPV